MVRDCIEIIGVSKKYRSASGERWALSGFDLKIEQGEFVGIAGRNGSGKTTLARLLNGLLLPTEGRVLVNGMDTSDRRLLPEIRRLVGMVFQNPDNQIVSPIVEEEIAFGPANLGLSREEVKERVEYAIKIMGLEELRCHAPHLLSGGQKQKVAIASALAMRPAYLVLDEPTSMLDQDSSCDLIHQLKRLHSDYGVTIILISHHLSDFNFAERVVVLGGGSICLDGPPAVIFQETAALARCGLRRPEIVQLVAGLRQRGHQINPGIINVEQLVEYICQL